MFGASSLVTVRWSPFTREGFEESRLLSERADFFLSGSTSFG
jgi:hypothetical protein